LEISISSDLALYQALQRRTLAMDLTGLASYEVMRKVNKTRISIKAAAKGAGKGRNRAATSPQTEHQ